MINKALIEKEFPFLQDVTYLNIASTGVWPVRVQNAITAFTQNYVQRLGVDEASYNAGVISHTREVLAKLIGASPEEIGMTKNTCEGTSIIARGYPFQKGDNIVVSEIEHPSALYPWVYLAEEKGVTLNIVKSPEGHVLADDLFAQVDEHTKAVVVSAVQYSNGYYADLRTIGQECKKRGILFVVDAIQACGRLWIDVEEMHIDYLSCASFKGLLTPAGSGFVYCRKELIPEVTPMYSSYRNLSTGMPETIDNTFTLQYRENCSRFESSTLNYSGIYALSQGVGLILETGIKEIEAQILSLDKGFRAMLAGHGLQAKTPDCEERCSGIICMDYPKVNEEEIAKTLLEHKIYVTMRNGYIRFSFGLFNEEKDIKVVSDYFAQHRELFN